MEGVPTFSFLTTAYRSEDTLPDTIASVLAQTRGDWELIVVDNGPSDAVADVVTPHLADPRVRLVRQQNSGPVGGVMAAADVATGRYVVVLNSDDRVLPDFCDVTGRFLAANPGVAAVTCDAYVLEPPGTRVSRRSYLRGAGMRRRPDPGRPLVLREVIGGPCPYYTAPVARAVWDAVGGLRTDTPKVDDLDFWLRVVSAGHDVRVIPDRLAVFRVESGSVSRPQDPAARDELDSQLLRALRRAAEATGDPADLAAFRRVHRHIGYLRALRLARAALAAGNVAEARRECRRALGLGRTPRAAAMVAALSLAPRLSVRGLLLKRAVQASLQDASSRRSSR
ncbi:glycosyltransferase [Geodermatophilus sp. SYSU D00867]